MEKVCPRTPGQVHDSAPNPTQMEEVFRFLQRIRSPCLDMRGGKFVNLKQSKNLVLSSSTAFFAEMEGDFIHLL